ncbi:MAG TPA: branched-chain amino acid ABC transporter substrate-binding protein [Noviherbaspirillum sp.]|uniref:branched-chain amino acid ABC transporter substrate-binding protein n=1 Tax=Noviherbaspirillum sp. TaxID=1926288 RepID=UPI002B4992EE|nr:branched-chain amino acid ABC transporter substrate-binding protein [Noviherbaspirillum sp.]HJV88425.1 branched-chain amino acid ABC transporter substrate-binding protein [Noviherbaspirillum sp.]
MAMADTVRIAVIDPLSGPFAALGENQLHSWEMMADIANKGKWAGEHTLEFVAFDNKASPQESLNQLKRAIDQGFRYVAQANGSGAALALVDAINKHNERNPGKEVVYINHGAVDPDLTNSKCSFWHFSFDSNSDMKMQALVNYMSEDKKIKKVYIIGQDYAFGRSVSRTAKEYLGKKRPDVQIVGDDLHPIGQVKDFAPYAAKIKASGADTVITGNWGADLTLLIKAAKDAGITANFYTYYAGLKGAPTAMGSSGEGKVKYVGVWNVNNESYAGKEIVEAFKAKYNDDYTWMMTHSAVTMLTKAIKEAKSTDPVKVAFKLEGMKVKSLNGDVMMRAADHQLQQPLYIATWSKVNGKDVKFDQEGTGYGWKTDRKIASDIATQPTTCQMKRPGA